MVDSPTPEGMPALLRVDAAERAVGHFERVQGRVANADEAHARALVVPGSPRRLRTEDFGVERRQAVDVAGDDRDVTDGLEVHLRRASVG